MLRQTLSAGAATREVRLATETAQNILTQKRRDEVSATIENFELVWQGFDAQHDPELERQVVTDTFFQYFSRANLKNWTDESYWLIFTSAEVTDLIIYEYTETRFKAGACVLVNINRVQPDGTFVEHVNLTEICRIYVFVKEDSQWKLAGNFLTSLPYSAVRRDWSQRPEWLVETMGKELPSRLPEPRNENE